MPHTAQLSLKNHSTFTAPQSSTSKSSKVSPSPNSKSLSYLSRLQNYQVLSGSAGFKLQTYMAQPSSMAPPSSSSMAQPS
jgi:hypothetical protein